MICFTLYLFSILQHVLEENCDIGRKPGKKAQIEGTCTSINIKTFLFIYLIFQPSSVEESKHGTFNMLRIKVAQCHGFPKNHSYKMRMYQINHCLW